MQKTLFILFVFTILVSSTVLAPARDLKLKMTLSSSNDTTIIDMINLCLKWGAIAVTDEIYEHILYDGAKHISIASLPGMRDQTITINSISKTYSLTGWRVGWAIASATLPAPSAKSTFS